MLNIQFVNRPSVEELYYVCKEQVENPQESIYTFFDTYALGSSYEKLWQMFRLTLSNEDLNGWSANKRANWNHFFELLTHLITANYVLFLRMRNRSYKI